MRRFIGALLLATTLLVTAPAVASATQIVKAKPSKQFSPSIAHVSKGEKVVWKNVSGFSHTVTATSPNWHKDTTIHAGGSTSFTFKKTGTFKYHCTIHAGMSGKIIVG
jgi:plastocyanin